MASYLKDQQSNVVCGVGTWTYTVPATGLYRVKAVSSIIPPSDLVIIIKLNGVTQVTSDTPEAQNLIVSAAVRALSCTIADSVTVVISSAAGVGLNDVKTIISVGPSVLG